MMHILSLRSCFLFGCLRQGLAAHLIIVFAGLVFLSGCFRPRTIPRSPNPAGRLVPSIVDRTSAFPSYGRAINVDCFEPTTAGKHPAVILVHGADGLMTYQEKYRAAAHSLASEGFVVLLPHYFDRTGLQEAPDRVLINQHFREWMATLEDAVNFAERLENVDPRRIALVGHSLGAYLALSEAVTRKGSHLAAVVDYYGGLPKPFALMGNINQMPPTLILHGENDETVSPQEARDLDRLLCRRGRPHEIVFYKDQGHVFEGYDEADANRRTLAFLKKHLSGEDKKSARDSVP
jgi:carboxymethylenebutenolidase